MIHSKSHYYQAIIINLHSLSLSILLLILIERESPQKNWRALPINTTMTIVYIHREMAPRYGNLAMQEAVAMCGGGRYRISCMCH